ncbi:hypothetical protein HUG12_16960 [Halorarum salinum]|uniref:Uncharacterized protein n=2 Tax=Halorarum salinum TaxID=2743089 RepID=A0A7D5LDG3_9EURY|nr:hypothetical protein HUG12_16960 [Halobaculum salinum]
MDDADPNGPLETCEVGAELDSRELRRAWGRFHDGLTSTTGRDDWEGTLNLDAGEALFGDMDDLGREQLPERDEGDEFETPPMEEYLDENQDADDL